MLELKDINKVYKVKKSVPTQALKNINLNFNNKGMVFLLGKSGCGKSTLLNIIGGLDTATSGEIIIKGKSDKTFKQADYDSYRNTYLGFVFQEYNIIEEYSVKKNIELALELQGEKCTREEILNALKVVEMEDYIDRLPNQLSGGQRQRVAIARALVKNPEIILADEPTGSLDSESGQLVFNTLKELSKEKLIIVVTHDEESAKKYADRIIELKDGEVINDTSDNKITEIPENFKMIKSNLPYDYTLKMGLSSLKSKKIKLVFTIILTFIALTLFGLTNIFSRINEDRIVANTTESEKASSLGFVKYGKWLTYEPITNEDLKNIEGKYLKKYKLFLSTIYNYDSEYKIEEQNIYMYSGIMSVVEIASSEDITLLDVSIMKGYSELESYNDIYITDFLADSMIYYRVIDGKEYEDLLNKEYEIRGKKYIIKGIIDTPYDKKDPRIEKAKKSKKITESYDTLASEFGMYTYIVAKEGFVKNLYSKDNLALYFQISTGTEEGIKSNIAEEWDESMKYDSVTTLYVAPDKKELLGDYFSISDGSIKDNEIILDSYTYAELFGYNYDSDNYNKRVKEKDQSLLNKEVDILVERNYSVLGNYDKSKVKTYKVVGIYTPSGDAIINMMVSDSEYQRILDAYSDSVDSIIIQITNNKTETYSFIKDMNKLGFSHDYKELSSILYGFKEVIAVLAKIFRYVYGVMFIFVILLLSNFISNSIFYKRKEIGILRAIGARGKDVLKIFLVEGLFIGLFTSIISLVSQGLICNYLNKVVISLSSITVSIVKVDIFSVILVIGVALLIVFVSTFLSTRKISKQKPIDAILNR